MSMYFFCLYSFRTGEDTIERATEEYQPINSDTHKPEFLFHLLRKTELGPTSFMSGFLF